MKKTLSIILSLVMVLTMIPTFAFTAFAYEKTINNIHWGTGAEEKYIYWDPVDGAEKYDVTCGSGGGYVYETSYNCASKIKATGDYTVKIFALDEDGNQITDVAFSPAKHFEITPLPTPSNIQFDDETVSWDPIPNTRFYTLNFCRYDDSDPFNNEYQSIKTEFVYSGNSFSLDNFERENGKEYYFAVKAYTSNYDYGDSAYGYSAKFTYVGPVLATITNLAWGTGANEKVLTWDPVPEATEYRFTCGVGGGTVYTNSLNCANYIRQTGDITATIVAYKDTKAISKEATAVKHFELIDLSAPTNIQLVDDTITWDAVEHASKYYVKVCPFSSTNPYRPNYDTNVYNIYTTSTSIDYSSIKSSLTNGNDYYIAVKAIDESYNYGESQYGTSTKFTYYRTFTLTTRVDGENGTITPGATVNMGSNYIITVTPDKTYNLAYLKVNGVDVTNDVVDGQYTINDIQSDTNVVAAFSECDHDWGTGTVTTPATCGEKGVRTYTCSKCSKNKTEDIPKLETHTWDSGEITTVPNCKDTGVKTYKCTVCSATKKETVAKTDTHSYGDYAVTTPATCAHNGLESRTCSVCGVVDQRTIDPLPHDFTKQPYQTDDAGKHYQKCKVCGADSAHIVCTAGTALKEDVVAPTCDADGSHNDVVYCTVCNQKLSTTPVIDSATRIHDFSKYVSLGNGKHKVVCNVCDTVQPSHDNDACSGGTATCTAKAKCSTCGAEYGSLAAHTGGTATCTAKAKCTVCGEAYGELATHSYDTKWSTDATNHWHACSVCTTAKKDTAAHSYTWVVDKEATEAATGSKHEECTVCGYKKDAVTIDKLPAVHTHAGTKVNQVDATCTADGVKAYYKCSCGKYYTDSACTKEITDLAVWKTGDGKIAKTGHSGGTATCTAKAKCSTCGAEYGSEAAHTSQDVAAIPATCTENGKTAGKICSVCKIVLSGCEEAAAKGHTEVSADNAVAATCTKAGKESDTKCSVCGVTVTEGKEIKATGHKYNKGKITKAPTSAKKGVRTKKCTVCGNKKTVSVAKIAKTKLGKVSAKSKGFTVKWTKKTAATGYQIMYSTSKKFKSGNKKVTIKNAKTVSKTVKKLKAKKTYYVKVRCYKTIDGKKYYGAWTSVKKITTKR